MIYHKLAHYYDMFVDEKLTNQYVELVLQYKKEGTVLDLGTGTGPLAIALAKKGFHVFATDISNEMLEMAYNNAIQEDVQVQFLLHNILDTVNRDYDVICMSSDVINYLKTKEETQIALSNVSLAMNVNSIFIFDVIRPMFINKLDGHYEEILLHDDVLKWRAFKTNVPNQIKHQVEIGHTKEVHIQKTYPMKDYLHMIQEADMRVIKKIKQEERTIFVCKKEM